MILIYILAIIGGLTGLVALLFAFLWLTDKPHPNEMLCCKVTPLLLANQYDEAIKVIEEHRDSRS